MKYAKRYYSEMQDCMERIWDSQQKSMEKVVELFIWTIKERRTIWAFGCTHSSMLTAEIYYRAGGLIPIRGIFGPGLWLDQLPVVRTSHLEKLEGYGNAILEDLPLHSGDVLLVASTSGKNAVPVEVALKGKELGLVVVALTSIGFSKQTKSGHSSGKRLFEVADLVLDNGAPYGDALVSYPEFPEFSAKVAATSTVLGALILNSIVAEVVGRLLEEGVTPPIYLSGNIEDGMEHNKKVMASYGI